MALKKVKVDGIGEAVFDILSDYRDEVTGATLSVVEAVGRRTTDAVKQNISSAGIGGTKYKNSIRLKVNRGRMISRATIYSERHYRLTHLLEYGHNVVLHGKVVGTTRAFPHWQKAEETANKTLESEIKRVVQKL